MMPSANSVVAFPTVRVARRRLRHLWKRYLKWPAPLWRVKGSARLNVAGYDFEFQVRNRTIWWTRQVRDGKWEPGVRRFLKNELRPGDVFFDVGAWIGIYSLLASKVVGPAGHVYAFEPDPVAHHLLNQNVSVNGIENITVLPYAITDRDGSTRFDAGEGSSEGRVADEGTTEVRTAALGSFCAECRVYPSVIKITAMGQERQVFREAQSVLRQARVILLQFHAPLLRAAGTDPAEFIASLFELGRRVILLHQLPEDGSPPGTELTRQSAMTDYMKLALV